MHDHDSGRWWRRRRRRQSADGGREQSVTHFQEQNIDECNDDGMCTVTLTRGKLLYDIRRP